MGGLFLLFTVVPLIELFLLIRVGSVIGGFNTLLLVLVTGVLGASLARREGTRVVREWQQSLQQGNMPAEGVLSGVLVLVGGVLLITPGIVTDLVGLSLLLPVTRHAAVRLLQGWLQRQIENGNVQVYSTRGGPFGASGGPFKPPGAARTRGSSRPSGQAPRRPLDPRGGDVIDTCGEDVS